jgi:GMP synthase-like glutamine amidotransferase
VKTVQCFQHVPFEGPGAFGPLLVDRGYRIERRVVPQEGLPSDPGDLLLVMGGPMSVNDPDPWIVEELAFIRKAVEAGVPMLGICLGSQLLAKALGARIAPGPRPEIGMTSMWLTDEGRRDPAFAAMPDRGEVFQWHGEVFNLPAGAVSLAASDVTPVQAFRYKTSAYGVLFHLEMDRPGMEALCRECGSDLTRARTDAATLMATADPHLPRMHAWAAHLIQHLTA